MLFDFSSKNQKVSGGYFAAVAAEVCGIYFAATAAK
jgi:hypothetical protein